MTTKELIDFCLTKTDSYIDYPFGPDATIVKVKTKKDSDTGKIFAQFFTLKGEEKATFNCDRMTGEMYRDMYPEIVVRGYHCPAVQQPYFNTVTLNSIVPDDELLQMIHHSYDTVIAKLPKYRQKELLETK